MRAWALQQVEHLSPLEIVAAVALGLLGFALIMFLFRRRGPAPASNPHRDTPMVSDGPLAPVIAAAARKIVALARERVASAGIFHFGAVDIHPKHLAYWITTATDAERDRLAGDADLQDEFRRVLLRSGYPADAVLEVGFAFQSEETVQRDYGGNWFHAVK